MDELHTQVVDGSLHGLFGHKREEMKTDQIVGSIGQGYISDQELRLNKRVVFRIVCKRTTAQNELDPIVNFTFDVLGYLNLLDCDVRLNLEDPLFDLFNFNRLGDDRLLE